MKKDTSLMNRRRFQTRTGTAMAGTMLLDPVAVVNEKHDGYLRDGCIWKEEINICNKMAAQIKYSNGMEVSYSLTTYLPYEGYRIAFNGTKGRLDAWIKESQSWKEEGCNEIRVTGNSRSHHPKTASYPSLNQEFSVLIL